MSSVPLSPRQRQSILWIAVGIGFAIALYKLGPVLAPFIAAIVFAYVLDPLVAALVRRRVPRALATLVAIVLAVLAVTLLVLIVVPIVQQEYEQVRTQLPILVERVSSWLLPRLNAWFGVRLELDGATVKTWLTQQISTSGEDIATTLFGYLRTGGSAAMQVLGFVFLVPVLVFFLLLDWPKLLARVAQLVPLRWRAPVFDFTGEIDGLLAQYLRGQMLVMAALAAYYSIGLLIAGFDLWLPVGVLTGLLVFIPFIGFGIGLVLALIAGLLQFGPVYGLAAVAVVYGIGQLIESYWLTPRLVGERIGLPPLAVIMALLVFGALFGFIGVLLALPIAAVLAVALRRLRDAYFASEFYSR